MEQALNKNPGHFSQHQVLLKWPDRLEIIRQRINDESYLNAAIQRLALVMSNELMEFFKEGGFNERQRKKRKSQKSTSVFRQER